eukprot:scaffold31772_cov92-Cyclotella_meneghiniana.AAC.4
MMIDDWMVLLLLVVVGQASGDDEEKDAQVSSKLCGTRQTELGHSAGGNVLLRLNRQWPQWHQE